MSDLVLAVIDFLTGSGVRVRLAPFYEAGGSVRVCLVLDIPWEGKQ